MKTLFALFFVIALAACLPKEEKPKKTEMMTPNVEVKKDEKPMSDLSDTNDMMETRPKRGSVGHRGIFGNSRRPGHLSRHKRQDWSWNSAPVAYRPIRPTWPHRPIRPTWSYRPSITPFKSFWV